MKTFKILSGAICAGIGFALIAIASHMFAHDSTFIYAFFAVAHKMVVMYSGIVILIFAMLTIIFS